VLSRARRLIAREAVELLYLTSEALLQFMSLTPEIFGGDEQHDRAHSLDDRHDRGAIKDDVKYYKITS